MDGKIVARNALLPLMAKLIACVACALAESVTTNSGVYVPWPPTSELVIFPLAASRAIPSGSGEKLVSVLTENV